MGENPSRFQIVTGRNRTTEHREIANTLANAADRWHGRFSDSVVDAVETVGTDGGRRVRSFNHGRGQPRTALTRDGGHIKISASGRLRDAACRVEGDALTLTFDGKHISPEVLAFELLKDFGV
jgi:hypothetical protein